ncbi:YhgE/Pip domain-containing protein [Fictibacillus gelatini]|uniref:YhgE/Pip domain-containing protein n=1 Tax=Fictibacillus gelatini TaxID=225985 RepID=UPI000409CD20|nr:YhgE/Pip domain-containing protein [Fictibacillus gelatini]
MLLHQLKEVVRNKKLLISISAILFIPILYSGVYLWAFWDPYKQVDHLKIAVVNEDHGTEFKGKNLHIGKDLVKELKKDPKFDWVFTSKKEADKGIENNKYYAEIVLPDDFSKKATTVLDEHPKKLEINYRTNSSYNYLSTQISEKGIGKIRESLSHTITEKYYAVLMDTFGDNLKKAKNGATKLADGADKAANGANDLKNGAGKLADGASNLHKGLSKAEKGSSDLTNGLEQSYNGTQSLYNGLKAKTPEINKLSGGATELEQGAKSLAGGLGQLTDADKQLVDGQQKLKDGNDGLYAGIQKSANGIYTLQSKSPELVEGSAKLDKGANEIARQLNEFSPKVDEASKGVEELQKVLGDFANDPNTPPELKEKLKLLNGKIGGVGSDLQKFKELNKGVNDLARGATMLHNGEVQFNKGLNQVAGGQKALLDGAKKLNDGQQEELKNMKKFHGKLSEASNGANQLAGGIGQLANGTGQIGKSWSDLVNNVSKLNNGQSQLLDGSKQLSKGISAANAGSGDLASGAAKLEKGTIDLNSGLDELKDGNHNLKEKLGKASAETNKAKDNKDEQKMFSDPVKTKDMSTNKDMKYGTGFAPYFISIGLFVGALTLTIIFPMTEPAREPKNAFGWFISKYGFMAIAGIIQSLIADCILMYGLGLHVESVPRFILFTIITSLTFMAIIQFLVTTMGNPGRFIGIVLLILQLTSSAGTYPLELVPSVLQKLHSFLPMSYSIAGFRAVISAGDYSLMWQNVISLLAFMVPALLLTYIFYVVKMKKYRIDKQENIAESM